MTDIIRTVMALSNQNYNVTIHLLYFSIRIYFAQCVLTTETANPRKSSNANRSPIHPSYSTLIAWLGQAAGIFFTTHRNV